MDPGGRVRATAFARPVRTLSEPIGADEVEVFAKTGGNPFFVTEVLAAGDAHIPETVREVVLARAARLPRPVRRLLEAAAIAPTRTELWAAGDARHRGHHGTRTVSRGRILRADGASISFRHELARLAIEEATAPARRLALHRAALRALRTPPVGTPEAARLSDHAEAACDADAISSTPPPQRRTPRRAPSPSPRPVARPARSPASAAR